MEFIWNDRIITDLDEIANKFNTYLINIGHSLSNKFNKLHVWEWLGANKSSLNIAKTKYMVFHTSKKNVIYLYIKLKVNNHNIERVTESNFLGVILLSHMTGQTHQPHFYENI